MITPQQEEWASGILPGRGPLTVRGLRSGGAPWLLSRGGHEAVLRIGPPAHIATEAAALRAAGEGGVPVPEVLGVRGDLLLIGRVIGSSAVPRDRDPGRLEQLGALAASIAAVRPGPGFERRARSLPEIDFARLRRESPQELLVLAEDFVLEHGAPEGDGLVHGDLWQGNVLWDGGAVAAVIDWDCAGVGPAGIDLGSLRLDAATAYGQDAAADILRGWERVAGPARDLAYWDVQAALATPPDIEWFGSSIREQGRPDLTDEVLKVRRDEFLRSALDG